MSSWRRSSIRGSRTLEYMGQIEQKLEDLGLRLPEPLIPVGNYVPLAIHGGLGYVAGHGPISGGEVLVQGVIGEDLTLEQGYDAARLTALSVLASLKQEIGELDRVSRWLKVVGYIHCSPRFGLSIEHLEWPALRVLGPTRGRWGPLRKFFGFLP